MMDENEIDCISTIVVEKLGRYPLTKMMKQDVLNKVYQIVKVTLEDWEV